MIIFNSHQFRNKRHKRAAVYVALADAVCLSFLKVKIKKNTCKARQVV